jgi:hypothetical protein
VLDTLEQVPYPDNRLTQADRDAGEQVLNDLKQQVVGMWD